MLTRRAKAYSSSGLVI